VKGSLRGKGGDGRAVPGPGARGRGANGRDRVSRWGYRLLALLIALALWYGTAAEKREPQSEKVVEATVTYSPPPAMVILNPIEKVKVGVRGNLGEIRDLRPFDINVEVDLSQARRGASSVTLAPGNVLLPSKSMQVQSIEPKLFTLQLDVLEQKRVPIEIRTSGEPAAGAIVTAVEVNPSTALISGPSTLLAAIDRLPLQAVDLNGHALTFEKEIPVVAQEAIRVIQPPAVTVKITMEEPPPHNP